MTTRPPIGTRYLIAWADGTHSGVTVVPTGKAVSDGEVHIMRDGDGSIVTVNVDRLGLPEVAATVAATLRNAAEWFSGDARDTMREAADGVGSNWDDACCPVCEEVTCDKGCPLEGLRAGLAAEAEKRHKP